MGPVSWNRHESSQHTRRRRSHGAHRRRRQLRGRRVPLRRRRRQHVRGEIRLRAPRRRRHQRRLHASRRTWAGLVYSCEHSHTRSFRFTFISSRSREALEGVGRRREASVRRRHRGTYNNVLFKIPLVVKDETEMSRGGRFKRGVNNRQPRGVLCTGTLCERGLNNTCANKQTALLHPGLPPATCQCRCRRSRDAAREASLRWNSGRSPGWIISWRRKRPGPCFPPPLSGSCKRLAGSPTTKNEKQKKKEKKMMMEETHNDECVLGRNGDAERRWAGV